MRLAAFFLTTALSVTSLHAQSGFPGQEMVDPETLEEGRSLLQNMPVVTGMMLAKLEMLMGSRTEMESPAACLSTVQAILNLGAMAHNMLPFASAHMVEDQQGPGGRLRFIIEGRQVHFFAHCEAATLIFDRIDWSAEANRGEPYDRGTLDLALGLAALGSLSGFLGDLAPPAQQAEELTVEPGSDDQDSAVDDAIAGLEALIEQDGSVGPLLTQGETEAFRLQVRRCWNVEVGTEAANVVVTIRFNMTPDNKVVPGSITQVAASGGSAEAIRMAYDWGRRAILRCQVQGGGYQLPIEKYAQWQQVEVTFNPEEILAEQEKRFTE